MKLIKKLLLFTMILIIGISSTSCSIFSDKESSEENCKDTQTIISNTAQTITLKQSEIEHIPSTVEEAVALVYDSVVVINASSISREY